MEALQAHGATVILSVLLFAAVVLAVVKIVKDKKNGKCSCGGQCAGCPMGDCCKKEKSGEE